MTPQQKIEEHILIHHCFSKGYIKTIEDWEKLDGETQEQYEDEFQDEYADALEQFRWSGEECNLEPSYHPYFESKQVVARLYDGEWVSWTYWYGGGKHACPEDLPWLEDAFFVNCREWEETITAREFKRKK